MEGGGVNGSVFTIILKFKYSPIFNHTAYLSHSKILCKIYLPLWITIIVQNLDKINHMQFRISPHEGAKIPHISKLP